MLLHLITPDGVEHGYGPNTPPAYQAVAESDQYLGEIRDALQQPPFAGNSTMFVVSDHGFTPYENLIRPDVVLKELQPIQTDEKHKVTERSTWCVAQGGSAFVYVLDDERRTEITDTLVDEFAGLEGILDVMSPKEFTPLGVPDPGSNPEASHLVLTTDPGYSFDKGDAVADAGGHKGSHGHDPRPRSTTALHARNIRRRRPGQQRRHET